MSRKYLGLDKKIITKT